MNHLLARLEALEAANRRWRHACLALLLGFATLFLMGSGTADRDELSARRLVLRDGGGVTRGIWEMTGEGSRLSLFGAQGSASLILSGSSRGGRMELLDQAGLPRLDLGFQDPDGAFLQMKDPRQRVRLELLQTMVGPLVSLRDAYARKRLAMIVTEAGPGISLLDSLGKSLLGLVVASDSPTIGLNDGLGRILWMAPSDR
ncbi:MAG: hypothetical protein GX442_22115 [Candidatus Riflebacteria bacterium]|nr:hypothetical protein [Candidatus Riflebacteria bacterium]